MAASFPVPTMSYPNQSFNMTAMADLAARSKIQVRRYIAIGSAHDWTTASNSLAVAIASLYPRLGLSLRAQTP